MERRRDGRRAVPPASDTDRLIVQTPGLPAASPNVIYTPDPSAADGGTLNLASLNSTVTINGIDVLIYDGQGRQRQPDESSARRGDDTIVHNPGANDQAGSFQVNSLCCRR